MTAVGKGREYWPTAAWYSSEGANAWRKAVHAQLSAPATHSDFHALAADLVDTFRAFDGLLDVLARQVAGYADGCELYDADTDPRARLRNAGLHLAVARQRVAEADHAVHEFLSAVGHVGVRP